MKQILWLYLFIFLRKSESLIPNKTPGGSTIKYISSVPPHKDLYKINSSQASLISKNWLENIVVTIFQRERKKLDDRLQSKNKRGEKNFDMSKGLFELEDAHIVTSINQLEDYIQNHRQEKDVYMCWKPRPLNGVQSVLFLVVAEINKEEKKFSIKQLVQSPFWSPEQIQSNKLKEALINMNDVNNCTKIDMNYLYEHDLRYRLAWATWNLVLEDDN
tara:strand:- start:1993 stop:2643 length:651 start_codon:yes stop_codon:yes gene_type:complete